MNIMKSSKLTISKAFKLLGVIDKKVESGKYTEAQHNKKTKIVLKKLVKANKR